MIAINNIIHEIYIWRCKIEEKEMSNERQHHFHETRMMISSRPMKENGCETIELIKMCNKMVTVTASRESNL